MPDAIDARIAQDNRALRALDRRNRAASPERPPLPDRALIGERLHDHGDDSGRKARTEIANELDALCRNVSTLRCNPTMNAAQIELAAAEMVKARVDRLLDRVEAERAVVAARHGEVQREIEKALSPPRSDWLALGAEFRAVMRSMSDDQRHAFIDSLTGGDLEVARFAVAGVPPQLSGVSLETHREMREFLLAGRNPELLTHPRDLAQRGSVLDAVEQGIRRTAAELVDVEQADALRALAGGSA